MHFHRLGRRFFVAIAAVLVSSSIANSDIVVSNLDQPFRNSTPIGNASPDEFWGAQSFVTDGVAYELDSIQAIMGSALNSPVGIFELRKDTGANEMDLTAGGLLTSFAAPALSGANSVRNFLPNNSVQLGPNTKYWFMAGVTNEGSFEWDYANTGFFTGPGSLAEFGYSADSGATWNFGDSPFFPYFLQVNGTPASVPEPTSIGILLACAGLATTGLRRRKL